MRPRKTKPPIWREREARFDAAPVPAVPFRGTRETELEQFKNRLLHTALVAATDPDFYALLRRAANEASGLVWLTPFPLLFLPVLFEELAAAAGRQFERAKAIRRRSRTISAALL